MRKTGLIFALIGVIVSMLLAALLDGIFMGVLGRFYEETSAVYQISLVIIISISIGLYTFGWNLCATLIHNLKKKGEFTWVVIGRTEYQKYYDSFGAWAKKIGSPLLMGYGIMAACGVIYFVIKQLA